MKVIGITGGVGAGKSSVLALLKEMCSCDIIQADLVARNIHTNINVVMFGQIANINSI